MRNRFSSKFTFLSKVFLLFVFALVGAETPALAQERIVAKPGARLRPRVSRPTGFNFINISGVATQEKLRANLSGFPTDLQVGTQGVQIGYTRFQRWLGTSWLIEPFIEYAQSDASEKDVNVDFRQNAVPSYGAGLSLTWAFFVRPNGTLMGLTTRNYYRLIDLQKPFDEDMIENRLRFRSLAELAFSWAITPNWFFTHSFGSGVLDPGFSFQAGIRWRM
jgi:hypothetical protein